MAPLVVRRISPDDGLVLRDIRLAALADMPGAYATTLAEARQLSDDRWSEIAGRNSSGANQAIWFAPPPASTEPPDQTPTDVVEAVDGADAEGSAPVGMLAAFRTLDDVVTLTSLWAAPGYRRIGVAEALVAEAAAWARGSGSRQLRIWVVEANEGARQFYASLGFAATGASMRYEPDPRLTSIELRCPLGPGDSPPDREPGAAPAPPGGVAHGPI